MRASQLFQHTTSHKENARLNLPYTIILELAVRALNSRSADSVGADVGMVVDTTDTGSETKMVPQILIISFTNGHW